MPTMDQVRRRVVAPPTPGRRRPRWPAGLAWTLWALALLGLAAAWLDRLLRQAGRPELAAPVAAAVHAARPGDGGGWRPGMGLRSMAERAAEVGGVLEAGPTPAGGRVQASLPLELP